MREEAGVRLGTILAVSMSVLGTVRCLDMADY